MEFTPHIQRLVNAAFDSRFAVLDSLRKQIAGTHHVKVDIAIITQFRKRLSRHPTGSPAMQPTHLLMQSILPETSARFCGAPCMHDKVSARPFRYLLSSRIFSFCALGVRSTGGFFFVNYPYKRQGVFLFLTNRVPLCHA